MGPHKPVHGEVLARKHPRDAERKQQHRFHGQFYRVFAGIDGILRVSRLRWKSDRRVLVGPITVFEEGMFSTADGTPASLL